MNEAFIGLLLGAVIAFGVITYLMMKKVVLLQNCSHEYEIFRICKQCGHKQRGKQ